MFVRVSENVYFPEAYKSFKFKFYSNDACNTTFKYDVELLRYIF